MRLAQGVVISVLCIGWLDALQAVDRYVWKDGTNDVANGYTNWAGAATTIQDAVRRFRVCGGIFH